MTSAPSAPGPEKGMTLQEAAELQRDTLQFLMNTVDRYGDVVRVPIGFWELTLVSHPAGVKHVLLDNWRNYSRDTFQFKQFARVTGDGLLNLSGDRWQSHRRMAQPGFHKRKLQGMSERMRSAIEAMRDQWVAQLQKETRLEVDLDAALLKLAYQVIGRALFSLDISNNADQRSQELLRLMEYVIYRSQNLLAPPTWVPTPRNLRFRGRLTDLDQWVAAMIDERRASGQVEDDFLDLLLAADWTPQEVRDEIVTMIIAGYETVATGMGWLFSLVAQHSAEADRVRDALDRSLGDEPASYDILQRVEPLDRFIQEGFRLYPPSWLITRKTIEPDEIGGYPVSAGQLVVISPYAVHRHPDFWDEPERFDPNRFIGKSASDLGFSYIPFGGGPHLCIGRPLALLEAGLTLATWLPQFHFELVGDPPKVDPMVTLRPKPGLMIRLSLR